MAGFYMKDAVITEQTEFDHLVIFIEKIFSVRIPDDIGSGLGDESRLQGWLEDHISSHSPQKHAIALLRRLAQEQQRPSLDEDADKPWRKEQIAAIVGDLFCQLELAKSEPELAEFIWLAPPPVSHRHSFMKDWRKLFR